MAILWDIIALLALTPSPAMTQQSPMGIIPPSAVIFSSNFSEPSPPLLVTELKSHWMQHKYDEEVSHIAAGYWYNSARASKVRVDETYDGAFGSSLFDFTNMTTDGGVANQQWLIGPSVGSIPQCENTPDVVPGFPLLVATLLQDNNATWGGLVNDHWLGEVASWHILFGGAIPATVYLDQDDVVQGYDFWGVDRRTKVFTRFFNVEVGKIDSAVFDNFPC